MDSRTRILVLIIVGVMVLSLIFTRLFLFPMKNDNPPLTIEQISSQLSNQSSPHVVGTTCDEYAQQARKNIFLPDTVAKIEKGAHLKMGSHPSMIRNLWSRAKPIFL